MKKIISSICMLFSLVSAPHVNAALLSLDDSIFGADSITHDTGSGFEWLDVTLSTNRSYNYVINEFETGGDFEGFRYATNAEVTSLFQSAGIDIFRAYRGELAEPVSNLQDLVGVTSYLYSDERSPQTSGVTGDFLAIGQRSRARLSIADDGCGGGSSYAPVCGYASTSFIALENDSSESLGHWLIRDASGPFYDALVTTGQDYIHELVLGDTLSFDFLWEMGVEPTEFNLDILGFRGDHWEVLGADLNFGGSSTDWENYLMDVPDWAIGQEIELMFSVHDFGQQTDPTVYLRNIESVASVPEPSTLLLMATGLAGLGFASRKKRIEKAIEEGDRLMEADIHDLLNGVVGHFEIKLFQALFANCDSRLPK